MVLPRPSSRLAPSLLKHAKKYHDRTNLVHIASSFSMPSKHRTVSFLSPNDEGKYPHGRRMLGPIQIQVHNNYSIGRYTNTNKMTLSSSSFKSALYQGMNATTTSRFLLQSAAGASTTRSFSSSGPDVGKSGNNTEVQSDAAALSVDETLDKLFAESSTALVNNSSDAWYNATGQIADAWSPVWYNCADQAIVAVQTMHATSGLSYGWSIVATTVTLRVVLFPLLVQAQQATSRMAHVQPELSVLKVRYEKLGSPTRAEQMQFSANMKALFAKYKVNPFKSMIAPLVQLPIFIGMFFGLKKMPGLFPEELSTGGMYWFVDLTAPDPLYILPVVSAITFLGLIEMGKEQMLATSPGPQGLMMLNVFRFMGLISLPFCASFESAMLCYWASNNILTIGQTAILKTPAVRRYFGIWDPPKPIPGAEATPGLVESVTNLVKRVQGEAVTEEQKMKKHNQEVDAKKSSFRMTRAAKERRRTGITGTRNN